MFYWELIIWRDNRWYKPGELGKRSGIFTSSGLIGTLYVIPTEISFTGLFHVVYCKNRFSGLLQAAVYQWVPLILTLWPFFIDFVKKFERRRRTQWLAVSCWLGGFDTELIPKKNTGRWLFIIDSVITFPIALYGFLVFPDVPATTTAFYLSEEVSKVNSMKSIFSKPIC